ncbi:VPS4B-like protein [Mya arenaria]|uniref:VPS4B-like protein n=1 Tax=Mya arenaria TaxID=6604 RepID=A0ABY7ETK8_MYAAR|nr:VPS4B-like protein [Mya arenaria]
MTCIQSITITNLAEFEMPEHRVEWTDVKGAQDVKDALKECILLPLKFPALFKGVRVPHRGVLLLGTEAGRDVSCFYVHAWDLLGKYSGDPEEKLRALFSAAQSRELAIIFLDDIEVIGSDSENDRNRRACNEMLIGFSQLQNYVFVVGLTHAPWAINLALLKRFSKRLYMPLPDTDARTDILGAQLRSMDHTLREEHLRSLSSRCAGFSGSDLVVLVRDVAMEPVRRLQAATYFKKGREGRNSTETFKCRSVRKNVRDFCMEGKTYRWERKGNGMKMQVDSELLDEVKNQSKDEIESLRKFREEINNYLDRREKELLDNFQEVKTEDENLLTDLKTDCEAKKSGIEALRTELSYGDVSVNQRYVAARKAQK